MMSRIQPGGHDAAAAARAGLPACEQQAEAADVAQRRADPAVGHGVAVRVDGDLRIELGSHRLPDQVRDELVQARAAGLARAPSRARR